MYKIEKSGSYYTYDDLVEVMSHLRSEEGCPWDREQDHKSLKVTTLEEAYEVVEAINMEDDENLIEELGDLLLQVVFHAQIAGDEARFTMNEVTDTIVKKLIRRHPHVFSTTDVKDAEEVTVNWDAIKRAEKDHKTVSDELKSVPKALPALVRAGKVQKKAARIGFDFPDWSEAFKKVEEETMELHKALQNMDKPRIEEEFGDLLFSIVNVSRFLEVNPENSLTNTIEKFINRFEGVETLAKSRGLELSDMNLSEMDALWDEVKRN